MALKFKELKAKTISKVRYFIHKLESDREIKAQRENQEWLNDKFMSAVWGGDIKEAKRLLEAGASADAESTHYYPAFIRAAEFGHTDLCRLMLKKGTKWLMEPFCGLTTQSHARMRGRYETAEFLNSMESLHKLVGMESLSAFLSFFDDCKA